MAVRATTKAAATLIAYQKRIYPRVARLKAWHDASAETWQAMAALAERRVAVRALPDANTCAESTVFARRCKLVKSDPTDAAAHALLGVVYWIGLRVWVRPTESYTTSPAFRHGVIAAVSELVGEPVVVPEDRVGNWSRWFWGLLAPLNGAIQAGRIPGLELVAPRPKPALDPAEAKRRDREARIARSRGLLAMWERKAKFAETKLRKYRRSLAALERARGAGMTARRQQQAILLPETGFALAVQEDALAARREVARENERTAARRVEFDRAQEALFALAGQHCGGLVCLTALAQLPPGLRGGPCACDCGGCRAAALATG